MLPGADGSVYQHMGLLMDDPFGKRHEAFEIPIDVPDLGIVIRDGICTM